MKRKLLSALLAVSIIASLFTFYSFTASAYTDGYYTYTVSNGEALITGCNTSISGSITIPSTLGGYPVTSIFHKAFIDCTGLTSITIPNSVTRIGDSAFYNCTGLTSIIIPDSVTNIGQEAFYGCDNLAYNSYDNAYYLGNNDNPYVALITISNDITSCTINSSTKIIADHAFYYRTELTSITIPDSVTSIGDLAFGDCTGLTSVTIPNSVTSIGYRAFYGCTGLTSVTIGNGVTSIGGYAFSNCTELKQVIYIGTNAQYSSISIGSGNNDFTNIAPIYHIVHTFDDDLDTTCDICGYVRIVETSGDGWDYDDGKMTFDGEITAGKWEAIAGKVTEITMGKSVKEIGGDFFSHFDKLEKFIIMGNPTIDASALPDDPEIEICGWSNTNIQSACETKGLNFNGLEEFAVDGYQDGYTTKNSFRAAAQMRYAEYYTAAGYDITAVGSDGYGHKFNRKISHEITTVYKSLTGRLENGSVGTVKTADEGCYLSAIGFTELPEMTGDGAIIFTITPYVYNPYSDEKISLEPVEFKYTADGVKPYTSLKLNNGSSDGKEIAWSDFKD